MSILLQLKNGQPENEQSEEIVLQQSVCKLEMFFVNLLHPFCT